MKLEIISKEKAQELGQKWYFTGTSCKNNHIDKRYVNTGICYGCKRKQNIKCNHNNPETLKAISRRSYENNIEKKTKYSKDWVEKNRKRSNNIKKAYKERNRKEYLEYCRAYMKRKRLDPSYRISKNLSKAIWASLKGKKEGKTWLSFVDFTIEDLIKYIEPKFKAGMTWENYGPYWHIDHIKPLSWFDLDTQFKEAWDLNNLQPLEAYLNLSKNNRYEG